MDKYGTNMFIERCRMGAEIYPVISTDKVMLKIEKTPSILGDRASSLISMDRRVAKLLANAILDGLKYTELDTDGDNNADEQH